jgi:hypothetical protein
MSQEHERRVYPRIETEWPLYMDTGEGQQQVGHVANISLSGALLRFDEGYKLDPETHSVTLTLRNDALNLPELSLSGLRTWSDIAEDSVNLAILVEELDSDRRNAYVRYLSRSDRLQVTAIVEQAG